MRKHKSLAAIVLFLASLPLMADTCTEEKVVEIVLGFPTTAEFQAFGEQNTHQDTDEVDVKADIDIAGELANAGIDPNDLNADELSISRIFYRCTRPDPQSDRKIVNGFLRVTRLDTSTNPPTEVDTTPLFLVTGWSGDFGAVTDWIDITDTLGQDGIDLLNTFLRDCLRNIQDASNPPPPYSTFRYEVSGDSTPANVVTNFDYEVMVQFQTIVPQTFNVPF